MTAYELIQELTAFNADDTVYLILPGGHELAIVGAYKKPGRSNVALVEPLADEDDMKVYYGEDEN